MVAPAVEGIDLFKIAGRSISGWIPGLKTSTTVRQPFCSQLEERLHLRLEYHLARSRKKAVSEVAASDKCTFSGVVHIPLQRFEESGVSLVECPGCGRVWTLSPSGGVLRFKSHDKRKTNTPNTGRRWARGERETDWEVVGGERT